MQPMPSLFAACKHARVLRLSPEKDGAAPTLRPPVFARQFVDGPRQRRELGVVVLLRDFRASAQRLQPSFPDRGHDWQSQGSAGPLAFGCIRGGGVFDHGLSPRTSMPHCTVGSNEDEELVARTPRL